MKQVYLTCLLAGLAAGPAVADAALPPRELLTAYYPAQQVLTLSKPDYVFKNVTMHWSADNPTPSMILVYHKAVDYLDRGLTLHLSLTLRHYPSEQLARDDKACKPPDQARRLMHPRLGPYLLCSHQQEVPDRSGTGKPPLVHVLAHLRPLAGNRAPKVQIYIDALPADLIKVFDSLQTYADTR